MLNINTATAEQIDGIDMLKGHGFEIVRTRNDRGGFTDLRQLDEVPALVSKTDGVGQFVGLGT